MEFINSTIFFAPFLTGDFEDFKNSISAQGKWKKSEKLNINYLYSFCKRLSVDKDNFVQYELKDVSDYNIYKYEDRHSGNTPEIFKVTVSAFSTGVGFGEIWVKYPSGMSVEEMADFAFDFKNADKADRVPHIYAKGENQITLYTFLKTVLPQKSKDSLFFANESDFKKECFTMHMLYLDSPAEKKSLSLLKYSHNTNFKGDDALLDRLGMDFSFYDYNTAQGSQTSLLNYSYAKEGVEQYFFKNQHYEILTTDMRFCILLLLNLKYTSIKLFNEMTEATGKKNFKKISQQALLLKTLFALQIVSDDDYFQNVYSGMYDVMSIDQLMSDLQDSIELITVESHEKNEKLLEAIAFLAVFSTLIDSASYFDRIPFLDGMISTILAFVIIVLVLVYVLFRRR